jgi:site-specific recombinase XerD
MIYLFSERGEQVTNEKFEKLVKEIMEEAAADGEPVTKEEAEEMARMEIGAKEIKRYERSVETSKKGTRIIPKDEEKVKIIKEIYNFLLTKGYKDVTIVNEQREVKFNENFSITLTKHRIKKGV